MTRTTLFSSAAALCLVLAAPAAAVAQPDHHRDHEHHDGDHNGGDHRNDHRGGGHHDAHHGARHGDRRGGWHGGDHRGGREHHDWSRFRHAGRAHHRYHHGHFYWPHGYHYRRWTFGDILPSIFFGSRYWLSNWSAYDLYPPPPGARWVRYGPDALLIDRYSGEVIRVEYGIFY